MHTVFPRRRDTVHGPQQSRMPVTLVTSRGDPHHGMAAPGV